MSFPPPNQPITGGGGSSTAPIDASDITDGELGHSLGTTIVGVTEGVKVSDATDKIIELLDDEDNPSNNIKVDLRSGVAPAPAPTGPGRIFLIPKPNTDATNATAGTNTTTATNDGNVHVDGSVSVSRNILATNGVGAYNATGNTSLTATATEGVLSTSGKDLHLSAGTAGTNKVRVINTTASTDPTTGALIVDGGVGIAGDLNVAGNISGTIIFTDIDTAGPTALDIGGTNANKVNISRTGIETEVLGSFKVQETAQMDDIDTLTPTTLLLGKATATKVEIADTSVITEVQGPLTVEQTVDMTTAGTLQLGPSTATRVEIADTGVVTDVEGPLHASEGTLTNSVDALNVTTLAVGASTATKVEVADTGVVTEVKGPLYGSEGTLTDSVDALTATTLTVGASTATKVEVADTGVTTEVQGPLTALEGVDVTGELNTNDIDALTATTLTVGKTIATRVEIADTGIVTDVEGPLHAFEGTLTDSVDALTATTLTVGSATATKVELADTGVVTEIQGPLHASEGALTDSVDALTATTLAVGSATATRVEIADTGVITDIEGPLHASEGTFTDSIDALTATTLVVGASTATKVEIADTGVTTEVQGPLNATEGTLTDDIDTFTAATLLLGKATATRVEIADAGVITDIEGPVEVEGSIDTATTTTLQLGPTNANKVELGANAGVTTETKGPLDVLADNIRGGDFAGGAGGNGTFTLTADHVGDNSGDVRLTAGKTDASVTLATTGTGGSHVFTIGGTQSVQVDRVDVDTMRLTTDGTSDLQLSTGTGDLALTPAGNVTTTERMVSSNTTSSTDKDTGSIVTEGGLGVEENINAGGYVRVLGTTGGGFDSSGATELLIGETNATSIDLEKPVRVSSSIDRKTAGALDIAPTTATSVQVGGTASATVTLSVNSAVDTSALLSVTGGGAVNPTLDNHIANKKYVDDLVNAIINGRTYKTAVHGFILNTDTELGAGGGYVFDSTANTITSIVNEAFPTIDTVVPVEGYDYLVIGNDDSSDNIRGIYKVSNVGAGTQWVLTRREDFDNTPSNEVKLGSLVPVSEGSVYKGNTYLLTGNPSIGGPPPDTFDVSASTESSTYQAGSSGTSIVLNAGANGADDFYNGFVITSTSGASAGQSRTITDYVGATQTATIDVAFGTDPSTGDDYTINGSDFDLQTWVQVNTTIAPGSTFTVEGTGANDVMLDADNSKINNTAGDFTVESVTALILAPTTDIQTARPFVSTNATASTSKDTGSIVTNGGLGVEGDIFAGGSINATAFDSESAETMTLGASTATRVEIADTGVITDVEGPLHASEGTLTDSVDALTATTLTVGSATATRVEIADTGVVTDIEGPLHATEGTLTDSVDALTATTLTVGASTATKVEIAKAGVTTDVEGPLQVVASVDTIGGVALQVGSVNATQVDLGASDANTNVLGEVLTIGDQIPGGIGGLEIDTDIANDDSGDVSITSKKTDASMTFATTGTAVSATDPVVRFDLGGQEQLDLRRSAMNTITVVPDDGTNLNISTNADEILGLIAQGTGSVSITALNTASITATTDDADIELEAKTAGGTDRNIILKTDVTNDAQSTPLLAHTTNAAEKLYPASDEQIVPRKYVTKYAGSVQYRVTALTGGGGANEFGSAGTLQAGGTEIHGPSGPGFDAIGSIDGGASISVGEDGTTVLVDIQTAMGDVANGLYYLVQDGDTATQSWILRRFGEGMSLFTNQQTVVREGSTSAGKRLILKEIWDNGATAKKENTTVFSSTTGDRVLFEDTDMSTAGTIGTPTTGDYIAPTLQHKDLIFTSSDTVADAFQKVADMMRGLDEEVPLINTASLSQRIASSQAVTQYTAKTLLGIGADYSAGDTVTNVDGTYNSGVEIATFPDIRYLYDNANDEGNVEITGLFVPNNTNITGTESLTASPTVIHTHPGPDDDATSAPVDLITAQERVTSTISKFGSLGFPRVVQFKADNFQVGRVTTAEFTNSFIFRLRHGTTAPGATADYYFHTYHNSGSATVNIKGTPSATPVGGQNISGLFHYTQSTLDLHIDSTKIVDQYYHPEWSYQVTGTPISGTTNWSPNAGSVTLANGDDTSTAGNELTLTVNPNATFTFTDDLASRQITVNSQNFLGETDSTSQEFPMIYDSVLGALDETTVRQSSGTTLFSANFGVANTAFTVALQSLLTSGTNEPTALQLLQGGKFMYPWNYYWNTINFTGTNVNYNHIDTASGALTAGYPNRTNRWGLLSIPSGAQFNINAGKTELTIVGDSWSHPLTSQDVRIRAMFNHKHPDGVTVLVSTDGTDTNTIQVSDASAGTNIATLSTEVGTITTGNTSTLYVKNMPMRWVVIKKTITSTNNDRFNPLKITINGAENFESNVLQSTAEFGMYVQVGVSGSTAFRGVWMDLNEYYDGTDFNVATNGQSALGSSSTNTTRYVTRFNNAFGEPGTGSQNVNDVAIDTVFVKIGLPAHSTRRFTGVTVETT